MMAKRKPRTREPNGRLQRDKPLPTAEIKRLRDSAIAQVRHPEWGTVCGVLFLTDKIDAAQYEASKRWAQSSAAYRSAMGGPAEVKAITMERGHGNPADPDSPEGQRQATHEAHAMEAFREAHAVLVQLGGGAYNGVFMAVNREEYPVGSDGLTALNRGLSALAAHWGLTNQGKRDVR